MKEPFQFLKSHSFNPSGIFTLHVTLFQLRLEVLPRPSHKTPKPKTVSTNNHPCPASVTPKNKLASIRTTFHPCDLSQTPPPKTKRHTTGTRQNAQSATATLPKLTTRNKKVQKNHVLQALVTSCHVMHTHYIIISLLLPTATLSPTHGQRKREKKNTRHAVTWTRVHGGHVHESMGRGTTVSQVKSGSSRPKCP